MRMFGAPGLSRSGSFLHFIFDSCNVGPATLAEGAAGNGRTEPSSGVAANAAVVTAHRAATTVGSAGLMFIVVCFWQMSV